MAALATIPAGSYNFGLETLQAVFSASKLVGWTPPPPARKMDYSGALISVVQLEWAEGHTGPETVLVKFVDPVDALAGVAEAKAQRTIRSYANEAAFLSQHAAGGQQLQKFGCRVPTVHAVETEEDPFRLLVVMECLSPQAGLLQLPVLPREASLAALTWLARFHAYGYTQRDKEVEDGLWPIGGHTSLPNRPPGEVERLPESFEKMMSSFQDAGLDFVVPPENLATRLAAVAYSVDRWIAESRDYRTLSHGDYKAGNIFVQDGGSEVCVIDWQWTGWNVTSHDVIYFFATSAPDDCCDDYEAVFAIYHAAFVAALPEEARMKAWPIEEHMRLFQLVTLDYMRWAISYRLGNETPQKMAERANAVPVDANQGEYRRSVKRLSWLLQLVVAFLPAAESGALGAPAH